jgi:tetratricopeptide (TPR) repeat protein
MLGEIAAKEALEEQKAALDKQYADAISTADLALQAKDYEKALAGYKSALNLKPGETYAQGKINEINGMLGEIRKQEETNNQYDKIIKGAEAYLAKEQYEEARTAYQEALAVKPAEDLPKKKIADINQKLELMAAENAQRYQTIISKADNYFDLQDYQMAKVQYEQAITMKPDEPYPQNRMKLVDDQIVKKKQLIQAQYDKTIIDADRYYAAKTYDNAIDSYRAASVLKPDEEYPKEMARRILKLLGDRSIVQINKDPLLIMSNTEYKFEFLSVPAKDRKSNYIFFRARNISKTDYKLIISYGKDQTKNGGFVLRVPAGEDMAEFIVRISEQYKWFSEDNNWITFYPEGGDVEVSQMQISYSD